MATAGVGATGSSGNVEQVRSERRVETSRNDAQKQRVQENEAAEVRRAAKQGQGDNVDLTA